MATDQQELTLLPPQPPSGEDEFIENGDFVKGQFVYINNNSEKRMLQTPEMFDFVGVSRRPDGIKRADAKMFDQQKNNPMYYFMVDPKEEKETLRQRVQAQGLTWNSLFADN